MYYEITFTIFLANKFSSSYIFFHRFIDNGNTPRVFPWQHFREAD
jgi:hypothetical protein